MTGLSMALAALVTVHGVPAPNPAAVWFELGHRVVARIAERRLTPAVAAAVRELLGGQDIREASLWADQVRGQRRNTSPLHYVNIPLSVTAYDSATRCPGGRCIIAAIAEERRVLADPASSTVERSEALRFLIHFLGDLHQPLHVSDDGDRGGNDTQVQFFDRGSNLHKVWDGELIVAAGLGDEEQYVAHLDAIMATLDLTGFERGTVVDWAMEGHEVAAQSAYVIPRNRHLGMSYTESSMPLVDTAIIRAGVRLAAVLNEGLAGYHPAPAAPALGPGTYADREAAAHVGETAMVVGTVVTVYRSAAGNVYLNFGADYPHQTFSGAVLNPTDPALTALDGLVGRRIGIRGLIKLYKGVAEIVIERREQIVEEP
ncbi:MAG: S1/P1 nuclease [Gemmatimonadota bacterium]|nr:S1/P1 nuclease [Gemmatimonadota bacterium]